MAIEPQQICNSYHGRTFLICCCCASRVLAAASACTYFVLKLLICLTRNCNYCSSKVFLKFGVELLEVSFLSYVTMPVTKIAVNIKLRQMSFTYSKNNLQLSSFIFQSCCKILYTMTCLIFSFIAAVIGFLCSEVFFCHGAVPVHWLTSILCGRRWFQLHEF